MDYFSQFYILPLFIGVKLLVVVAKDEAVKPPMEKSSEVVAESEQVLEVASQPPSELEVTAAAKSTTIVEQMEPAVEVSVEHCEQLLERPAPGQLLAADIAQQSVPEMLGLETASAADAASSGEGASVDHREWTTTIPARRCAVCTRCSLLDFLRSR